MTIVMILTMMNYRTKRIANSFRKINNKGYLTRSWCNFVALLIEQCTKPDTENVITLLVSLFRHI